jgi:hypothetical protein
MNYLRKGRSASQPCPETLFTTAFERAHEDHLKERLDAMSVGLDSDTGDIEHRNTLVELV